MAYNPGICSTSNVGTICTSNVGTNDTGTNIGTIGTSDTGTIDTNRTCTTCTEVRPHWPYGPGPTWALWAQGPGAFSPSVSINNILGSNIVSIASSEINIIILVL